MKISEKVYFRLLNLAIIGSTFSGLIRTILDRNVILIFDLIFILLAYFLKPTKEVHFKIAYDNTSKVLLLGIKVTLVVACLQIFNSNILDFEPALVAFRFLVYFLLFIPIGRKVILYTDSINKLFFLSLPIFLVINVVFGYTQVLFPTTFSTSLLKSTYIDMYSLDSTLSYRPTGFFQGTVQYALFSSLLFFIGLVRFSEKRISKNILLTYAFIIVGLLGLFFSMSRAAIVSTLLIFLLNMLFRVSLANFLKAAFISVAIGFLGLFLLGISAKLFTNVDFDSIILRYAILLNPSDDNSFREGRLERWGKVLPVLIDNPQGLGIGSSMYYDNEIARGAYLLKPKITESIFLDIWMELGFLPFLIFSISFVVIILMCIKLLRRKNLPPMIMLSIYMILLFYLPGFTSPNFSAFPFTFLFSIALGILLVYKSHLRTYENSHNRN